MLERISRASAHEITQTIPIIYIHSVSHGVNVTYNFKKNTNLYKKLKKGQKSKNFLKNPR